jgi:anti-sigma-K factor RskA
MSGAPSEREHGELAELASIEALGALDAADRARLALHLRGGCEHCQGELRRGRDVAAALAPLATPLPAPVPLRGRVLASIGGADAPEARIPARRPSLRRAGPAALLRRTGLAALASAAAAAALVTAGLRVSDRLDHERALRHDAEVALARAEAERNAALGERERLTALIETVGAPAARAVVLAGAEGVPAARGRAFLEPVGQRIVLLVYDLPPPPPGRTYQLWTIESGQPASAGTFDTSEAGRARHAIATAERFGDAPFLAVTVEPAGGVPQPTGPIVMAQAQ